MSTYDEYCPAPINTSHVVIPDDLLRLGERLAENAHEVWAARRKAEGWVYSSNRDDVRKYHPCLVPYDDLPDSEKEYDRVMTMETLKTMLALGCRIVR